MIIKLRTYWRGFGLDRDKYNEFESVICFFEEKKNQSLGSSSSNRYVNKVSLKIYLSSLMLTVVRGVLCVYEQKISTTNNPTFQLIQIDSSFCLGVYPNIPHVE